MRNFRTTKRTSANTRARRISGYVEFQDAHWNANCACTIPACWWLISNTGQKWDLDGATNEAEAVAQAKSLAAAMGYSLSLQ